MKVEPAHPVAELDVVALTRWLVDIESITYNEGAVGRELVQILAGRSFVVETMPVLQHSESRSDGERFNVYAGAEGETPDVVLSTHMDTVPPFFKSSEDDEYIYGRGACDAKGIIAAQILAAERLRKDGVRAALLFVVGEERDSAGAKVANEQPRGSRFLINGEPTDNRLALASKGTLRVRLTAKGKKDQSSLVIRGWQRSGAWAALFASGASGADYPRPTVVYAVNPSKPSADDGSLSQRPFDTIIPLCERLYIKPVTSFGVGDEDLLLQEVTQLTGVVLICWEHKKMAEAMVVAATALKNGDKDAMDKLKKATNCMACHNLYK